MFNNPLQMIKMIKDPKGFVMDYMKSNNNPILNNLLKEAENGNEKAIEDFANNLLKQQGMNLNDIINNLK